MAYGDLKGVLSGGATSITNPFDATGSVSVAAGDLIVAVIAERGALTCTGVSDNLGLLYTAQNAGTLSGTVSGRAFYFISSTSGTLTAVHFAATASSDDVAVCAAVFAGPFNATPLDTSPANITTSTSTPEATPASGTLAQAFELIVGWMTFSNGKTSTGSTWPSKLAIAKASSTDGAANSVASGINYKVVNSTASTTNTFTTSGNPSSAVVTGLMSFKFDVTAAPVPKYQKDWPVPTPKPEIADLRTLIGTKVPVGRPLQLIWPLPIAYDYSNSLRTWIASPPNVTAVVTYIPSEVTDWGTTSDIREYRTWIAPPQIQPIVVFPLNQYDWQLPYSDTRHAITFVRGPVSSEVVVTLPFNQTDWPLPQVSANPVITWIQVPQPTSPNLISSLITDWGIIPDIRDVRTWISVPQLVSPVVQLPLNQLDWPLPQDDRRSAISWTNRPPFSFGFPKNQYDWPLPIPLPRGDIGWVHSQQIVPVVVASPKNQYDWQLPQPQARQAITWLWSQLLTSISTRPVKQTDWPLPIRLPNPAITWTQSPQVPPVVVVARPIVQSDWPLPTPQDRQAITWIQTTNFATPVAPPVLISGLVTDWGIPLDVREIRTWTQSPSPTQGFVFRAPFFAPRLEAPKLSYWLAPVNVGLLTAPPPAANLLSCLVVDWGTYPSTREIQTWIQSPRPKRIVVDTIVQSDWPLPKGAQRDNSLLTWINTVVAITVIEPVTVPRAPLFAVRIEPPKLEPWLAPNFALVTPPLVIPTVSCLVVDWGIVPTVPRDPFIWMQQPVNVALLTRPSPIEPNNKFIWALPIEATVYPVSLRSYIFTRALLLPAPIKPINQQYWPVPVGPVYPDYLRSLVSTYALLLPKPVKPVNQQDWPLPFGPFYPYSLRSLVSTEANLIPPSIPVLTVNLKSYEDQAIWHAHRQITQRKALKYHNG